MTHARYPADIAPPIRSVEPDRPDLSNLLEYKTFARHTNLEVMVSDDKNATGSPDRDRISLSEDYEVRDWSNTLNVSEEKLREAIAAVGNSADKVREYLGRK